jgi:hypothetical protein
MVRIFSEIKRAKIMVQWEHCYLLESMVFTIAGDVVRDFDEAYEAWKWLEREGWGLVAIEPPDPIRPGVCKYYFKRQCPPHDAMAGRSLFAGKKQALSPDTSEHLAATEHIRRGKKV